MAACDAIFLSGDSFPQDRHIEQAVKVRLSSNFAHWIDQDAINRMSGIHQFNAAMEARQAALRRLRNMRTALPWVVFSRSSGCRVATLFAGEAAALAIVCLGYPFRRPNGPEEPQRFQHLATITTPTLIIQGIHDAYGGRAFPQHYRLSAAVDVQFVDCDHEFRIAPSMWDAVANRIAGFLAKSMVAAQR